MPFSFQHGKHFLPASVLSKHNIRSNKIWDRIYGKPVDELGDAILEIASYGKATLEQAIQRYTESQEKIHPQAFRAFLIGVEV